MAAGAAAGGLPLFLRWQDRLLSLPPDATVRDLDNEIHRMTGQTNFIMKHLDVELVHGTERLADLGVGLQSIIAVYAAEETAAMAALRIACDDTPPGGAVGSRDRENALHVVNSLVGESIVGTGPYASVPVCITDRQRSAALQLRARAIPVLLRVVRTEAEESTGRMRACVAIAHLAVPEENREPMGTEPGLVSTMARVAKEESMGGFCRF
eukprot:gene30613-29105_t